MAKINFLLPVKDIADFLSFLEPGEEVTITYMVYPVNVVKEYADGGYLIVCDEETADAYIESTIEATT